MGMTNTVHVALITIAMVIGIVSSAALPTIIITIRPDYSARAFALSIIWATVIVIVGTILLLSWLT